MFYHACSQMYWWIYSHNTSQPGNCCWQPTTTITIFLMWISDYVTLRNDWNIFVCSQKTILQNIYVFIIEKVFFFSFTSCTCLGNSGRLLLFLSVIYLLWHDVLYWSGHRHLCSDSCLWNFLLLNIPMLFPKFGFALWKCLEENLSSRLYSTR